MLIKRRSISRRVSKSAFETKFKQMGFEVVEEDEQDAKLSELSHDDLYELAQEYDVYGRTKMSDEELVEAIEEARQE